MLSPLPHLTPQVRFRLSERDLEELTTGQERRWTRLAASHAAPERFGVKDSHGFWCGYVWQHQDNDSFFFVRCVDRHGYGAIIELTPATIAQAITEAESLLTEYGWKLGRDCIFD